MATPDYRGFAIALVKHWNEEDLCDLDGGSLQGLLLKHNIIREVKFDPNRHTGDNYGAKVGDPCLVPNYWNRPAPKEGTQG